MSDQNLQNDIDAAEAAAADAPKSELQRHFTDALDIGFWEKTKAYVANGFDQDAAARSMLETREPNEIIDAFAEVRPDWKPVMDEIKNDPALSGALKNALVKDPTMLDGFAEMVDSGNGNTTPAELAQTLKDKQARGALTFVLNEVANKEEYEFSTLKRFMDGTRQQQVAQLDEMGFNPLANMDFQDILGLVTQFLRDPSGALNTMADMFATGPEQRQAMQPIIDGASKYFDVALGPIHGEQQGYGGVLADGIEWGNNVYQDGSGESYLNDLLGKTDAANPEVAAQREQAGQGNTNIAPDSFGSNVQMGQNGSLGGSYDTAALGATPERAPAVPAPTPPRQEPALAQ